MSLSTDIAFPRGGKKSKEKQKRNDVKKQPGNKKIRQREVETGEPVVVIDNLTMQTVSSGMVILGCVVGVEDYSLKMSLPGCLYGTVPIINVSDDYTDLMKAYAENPDTIDEEVSTLKALFHVGQTFPCKVISTKSADSKKNQITLSLNPRHVNEALLPSSLVHGMVLYCAVQSVEDHGYVMDIGIKNCPAFLSHSASLEYIGECNNGHPLTVGRIVQTVVDMPHLLKRKLRAGEAITLAAVPSIVANAKVKESTNISLNAFIPGVAVDAVVQKVTELGLVVDCLGFSGCVFKNHLKATGQRSVYSEGQNIQGTVLYVHPVTHVIHLTTHSKPSPKKINKMFGGLKKWHIVDKAVITAVQKTHICLKLKESVQGIAMKNELSDELIENVSKKFSVDDFVRCRVISLHYLDNVLAVSLKQSVLSETYVAHDDLTVGDVYEGKVKKLVPGGMVVVLSPGVQGFVRDIHMADVPLTKPELMFPPGKKVKCKVLDVDSSTSPPSVSLTCKKGMLMTKVPILSSYEEASVGLTTKGVIVNIRENGLVLSFLNKVQGWVPSSEFGAYKILHPDKVFFNGQVVKCRVINCYPEEKKLFLTLKIDSAKLFGDKDMSGKKFPVGKIVEVRVKQKTEKGLDVVVKGTKFQAFLPVFHLSDHLENCRCLLETYKERDVITVLCFRSKGIPVVTKKTSLLEAAENGVFHPRISEYEEQTVIPVVVKHFAKYGMFVELGYNITGLVPNKFMADRKIQQPEEAGFVYQQTLMGKIIKVEAERDRIELSTKMEDVYHKEYTYGLDMLQSYFDDANKIREYYSSLSDLKSELAKLTVGSVVSARITSVTEIGVLCELQGGLKGFANSYHCSSETLEENQDCRAVVLYVDIANGCVELSLRPSLVRNVVKMKNVESCKVKVGQIIKCEAVLIKKEFVLVALGGHAVGRFAFVPARRVFNDLIGREDLFSIGQHYHIVIKRDLGSDIVLGVLKQHVRDSCANGAVNEVSTLKRKNEEESVLTKRQKVSPEVYAPDGDKGEANVQIPQKNRSTDLNIAVNEGNDVFESQDSSLNSELVVGRKYVATIKKIKEFQMDILIKNRIPGRVHITEVTNDLNEETKPFKQYVPGSQVVVWVIGFHMKKAYNYLVLSHCQMKTYAECSLLKRPPVPLNRTLLAGDEVKGFVKEVNKFDISVWLSPSSFGTLPLHHMNADFKTLVKPNKFFRPGDFLEAWVFHVSDGIELTQLHDWKPEPGKSITGLVHMVSADKGISVKLPHDYCGEIHLTDVRDSYIPADFMLLPLLEKGLVRCYILEVNHSNKSCQLSTRVSRLRPSRKQPEDPELSEEDIKCGEVVRGFIKSITSSSFIVALGRDLEGVISISSKDLLETYVIGSVVRAEVLSNEDGKITLSIIREDIIKTEDVPKSKSPATLRKKRKKVVVGKNISDSEIKMETQANLESATNSLPLLQADSELQTAATDSLPRLQVSDGFNFDAQNMTVDLIKLPENLPECSDSDDDRAQKRKKRRKQDKFDEKQVFERENFLLDKNRPPETADEFEELVKVTPNVASLWVKYMAFYLEQMEIEKAKSVAERALQTISFREEQEKLNVCIALLNLENLYGTQESMQDVFDRALQMCEPLKLYNAVVDIYFTSHKTEEAENMYQIMTKKFHLNKEVWVGFGLFYMKTGRPELARKVMDRSLKSLDRKQHVDVIAKFAQMEFKHGDVSIGKSMFGNILKNYPKRTDLWSIYIDLLIKLGELDEVRKVFEQVITMKMSPRKMKFFFKRYLTFEREHGTEESSEEVVKKASGYFKSDFF